ncbi:protocadherin Fat 4-like [Liolophura sinensis]|uniref:protocadherin Fat 4-like n=1 Tax=Liolophura sinensis TaxID=3198878 RepID=UPI003158FE4B
MTPNRTLLGRSGELRVKFMARFFMIWFFLQFSADAQVTFTSLPDSTSKAENIGVGSVVYTVAPSGGTVPYTCSIVQQDPDNATRRFDFNSLDVKTTVALDYETTTQFVLVIECADTAAVTGTSSLTVNVQDVNDENPVISGTLSVTIDEEQAVGTPVSGLFNVSDADAGDVLTYALSGSDTSYFQIDSSSGTVSLKTKLDRDEAGARLVFNQLTLAVTDSAGNSAAASLVVTLDDINDNTPTFSPSVYYVTVLENTASGVSLVTVTCTDPDLSPGNGDITYAIASGDDVTPKFTLSGYDLQTTGNPIDYEALSAQNYQYEIIITGTDGGTVPKIGTATVSSENDASPAWDTFSPVYVSGKPYTVQEDVTVGSPIVTISATDADDGSDGTLTYSIDSIVDENGAAQSGSFRINSVSGVVMTNSLLERDPPSGITNYTILVRATDNGVPAKSVDRFIVITLLDANDNTPAFPQTLYDVALNEDEPISTSVLALTATDNDETVTFTYSIFSGNSGSKFQIVSDELQVQAAVDVDSPNNDPSFYTLVIQVVDGGSPQLTGSTTVLVSITPTNDYDPVFVAPNTVTIPESSSLGAVVTTITATDDDYGTDGTITYSILSGDSGNNFYLNAASGVIKLVKVVNFEGLSVNPILLAVVAIDGGGRSDTSTVTVSITDVNDNSPSCSSTSLFVPIGEDLPTGSSVQNLSCSDPDTSDTLSYTITSGNTDGAFLVTTAGVVQLNNAVDYESGTTTYFLVVEVSDGVNTEDVHITVTIDPVNEDAPAFSSPEVNVSWAEDTPTTTALTTYTASDSDAGTHGQITYAILSVSQSGSANFQVDTATGKIVLVKELDYEALTTGVKYYVLTVTATDGEGLQGTGTVTVSVTDVNDNAPTCSPAFRTLTNAENTNVGSLPLSLIASLSCTDPDDGALGTLTYTLTQSPSGTHFAVDSTGEVTLTSALDYESSTSYTLSITAEDDGTPIPKSAIVTVIVSVTNQNDGGPAFSGTFSKTLLESVSIGQLVDDVTASDPDSSASPEGELIYSIVSGDGNNNFIIDGSSGRVQVNKYLDRETTASYELVIQAVEQVGTNSASTTLTVSVTDVNDNTPSCPSVAITTSLAEDASVNDVILSFACTDADQDPTYATVAYTITSGDTGIFQILSSDLTLKALVDFDLGARSYDLTVAASDGTNTENIQVTVNISPVNEGAPVYTNSGTYSVDIVEDTAVGGSVTSVSASDSDSVDTSDGQVHYSFVTSYPNFQIDTDSGMILLQTSLDRESVGSYILLVKASDGSLSATATVTVTVTDVNDNAPIFSTNAYSGSVSETDAGGASVIVTVTAIDLDDPSTTNNGVVTYSIISGNNGGIFTIDSGNGEIKSTSSIDYDTLSSPSFSLIVAAVDRSGGSGSLKTMAVVTILVTSENDNSPIFTSASYNDTVVESISLGSTVSQVTAHDADSGDDGVILYTMASHPKFYLDQSSGAVTLKDTLDYETAASYVLNIVATDKGSPAKSSTTLLYVTVDDVNDNSPECSPATQTVFFREDTSVATTIASLTCNDLDDGANGDMTYSIYSVNAVVGNGPFLAMSGSSLILNSAFDYETSSLYTVVIHVVDGGTSTKSTTAKIVVSVSDVNEHDPAFAGLPYSKNVPEDAAIGDSLFTVSAVDADSGDTVSFTLTPAISAFSLDPQSGELRLNSPLDRETTDTYNLTILATDSGNVDTFRTTSTSLLISVTDVNDNSPVFNPASYSNSLSENTASGATVVSLTSTDQDSGANGDITYSILSGNVGNVFRVEKHVPSGECRLIVDDVTNLNYDTMTSFSLVIRATDGGGLTADAPVSLQLTGYNDFPPVFSPTSSSTESVAENSSVNDVVIDLNATDADGGVDGTITYSISTGASGKFTIDPTTGVVVVSGSLDKETTASYAMDVLAVDGGTNPSARTATYSLTVDVTDVNDVAPVCTRSWYSAVITENTAPSVSVSQVSCTDADTDSPNKDLVYSIVGGSGSGLFVIDASTGEVSTASGSSFDRETVSSYTLSVLVSDNGVSSLTESVNIAITISDENDNDPQFCCSPYSVSVGEEVAIDTSIYQMVASDQDTTLAGTLVYSIFSGNTGNKFTIDATTGDIRNSATLDRETTSSYSLTILATDLGTPARTGTATLMIDLTDFNDNAPTCSASYYYGNIAENAVSSDSVVTVNCTDNDEGANAVLVSSFLTSSIPFAIDGSSGLVTVSGTLDAETTSIYVLDVMVSDGSLSENVTVTVYISDINEHTPDFDPAGPYTVFIKENESVGTTIADLNATDADLSTNENSLAFSITAGNTENAFQINPTSGIIRVNKQLDYETTPDYTLEITVADGSDTSSLSSTTSLTVSLIDVNDNPPVCNPDTYQLTPNETASGSLLTLSCTDADTVSVSLTHSVLSGNTNGDLTLAANTGELSVTSALDYETTTSYDLSIEVSDGSLSSTALISLTVEPVNEHDPQFSAGSYQTFVSEDVAPGTSVLTVTATDQDAGVHGSLSFSIVSGNSDNHFAVEETTGVVKVAGSLNRERTAVYNLTIRASDQGTPPLKAYTSVSIQVLPVNEFTPTFTGDTSVTIPENTAVGTVILTASAMDNDTETHGDVVYSIQSGNTPGSPFFINSFTGNIQIWASLDYDTAPRSYTLGILAQDEIGNGSGLSSTMTFSVTLTDVNDETPTFTQNSYYFTFDENIAGSSSVGVVLALDSDSGANGQISYDAITGDTSVFTVDSTTGEIRTDPAASIDYETKTYYSLVIRASDAGSPESLSSQCIVYLTVTDLNDNKPVFQPATFTVSMSEDIDLSVSITSVVATDIDSGSNAAFTYTISPATHFSIHSTTGIITTSASFDRETTSKFELTVEATDQGSPAQTGTSTVTVEILDRNDNSPVITGTYDTSIPEDLAQGSVVFTVTAFDVDEGSNADLVYTISAGNTNNDWAIESENGIIQVANTLDRETTAVYHLVVVVTDKGTSANSVSTTVSLTIADVNDNTPVFSSSPYSFTIEENVSTGSSAGRIAATDADTGANSALQYELVYGQPGADHFTVDLASGDITTNANLDRETLDQYVLLCRVKDNGTPQLSSEVQVTISVTDLNDQVPEFGSSSYVSTLMENSVEGTSVLNIFATDKDTGVNAAISFSFNMSTSAGLRASQLLSVNSSTGVISTKAAIDRETDDVLNFLLIGTDGGTLPQSTSTSITISILDENDNNPVFTTLFLNLEVAYNGLCTNQITTVSATDADQGSNGLVTYFLVQNTNNYLFAVGENTGDVTLKATAEVDTKYLVYIMSQDNGATTRTSVNNLALRIDTFDPAINAISFVLSTSKTYFHAVQQNFVNDLALVYQTVYPSAVVRVWCVEERDGVANDDTISGRRRLLATGDKPVTVHTYVLSDNSTNSVDNVDVTKSILSSTNALSLVSDSSGSPSSAITGAGWSAYGIEQVTSYDAEETPWVQTTTGIAVIVCSVVGFLLLLLLTACIIYYCCSKRRKRPITPVKPMTRGADEAMEEVRSEKEVLPKHIHPMSMVGNDDLKKGIRPAVLSLPVPDRIKAMNYNSDVLRRDKPVYGTSLLARDFDGMAIDPASGKMYEYNTRTKERRWMSNQDGKAVTANNIYENEGSEYLNYHDDV